MYLPSGFGVSVFTQPREPPNDLITNTVVLTYRQDQAHDKMSHRLRDLAQITINSARREFYHLGPISLAIRRIYPDSGDQRYLIDWWNMVFVHLPFLGNR